MSPIEKLDQLSRDQLVKIVAPILRSLFLVAIKDGKPVWDRDKEVNAGDLRWFLDELCDANDLLPDTE